MLKLITTALLVLGSFYCGSYCGAITAPQPELPIGHIVVNEVKLKETLKETREVSKELGASLKELEMLTKELKALEDEQKKKQDAKLSHDLRA